MRLILVRHGQTPCNVGNIWHGWDDCALTAEGVRQAEATAARLAPEPIQVVYASDTRRAMQTAGQISAPHGLDPIPERGLRERFAGEFEGIPVVEVERRYPMVWEERDADMWGWRPPGGESLQEVLKRALGVIEGMQARYGGQTVAAVSHMATTRVLISHLADIPLKETFNLPFPSTGVSIFSLDGEHPRVDLLNDATHIEALQ